MAGVETTRLARQGLELRNKAKDNENRLHQLVSSGPPGVLALLGDGKITAATVMVRMGRDQRTRTMSPGASARATRQPCAASSAT